MRPFAFILVTTLSLWLVDTSPAHGKDAASEEARRHASQGAKEFQLQRWDVAIAQYEKAFELRQDPIFLYNIAQAYWKKGDHENAIEYYRDYLLNDPSSRMRRSIETRITKLEAELRRSGPEGMVPCTEDEVRQVTLLIGKNYIPVAHNLKSQLDLAGVIAARFSILVRADGELRVNRISVGKRHLSGKAAVEALDHSLDRTIRASGRDCLAVGTFTIPDLGTPSDTLGDGVCPTQRMWEAHLKVKNNIVDAAEKIEKRVQRQLPLTGSLLIEIRANGDVHLGELILDGVEVKDLVDLRSVNVETWNADCTRRGSVTIQRPGADAGIRAGDARVVDIHWQTVLRLPPSDAL